MATSNSTPIYTTLTDVTRFFDRIKHFRRLATRYEKHASNFRPCSKLAADHLWLRHNEAVSLDQTRVIMWQAGIGSRAAVCTISSMERVVSRIGEACTVFCSR